MIFSNVRVKDIYNVLHFSPQNFRFTSKKRTHHIIGIQLSGKANHFFASRCLTLEENQIYFMNQNEDYDVEVLQQGTAFSVHFTTYEPIEMNSFFLPLNNNASVLCILNRIEHNFLSDGGCSTSTLSDLYRLLSIFEKLYEKRYSPKDSKMQVAREYINLHFKEKDCIQNAVKQYGVSQRRFTDIFAANFHITPNQYLIHTKINMAKKLLKMQELTVGDVAGLCGFSDIYYFCKAFKKVTGQPPGSYRSQFR